jgi:hypothetical protein
MYKEERKRKESLGINWEKKMLHYKGNSSLLLTHSALDLRCWLWTLKKKSFSNSALLCKQ